MIVYKVKITAADCDLYEHMNTLKYMQKFYDAADEFMLKFGFSDPILAKRRLGCAFLEFNTKFIKEVFAGNEILIDAQIKEKGSKVVTILLQMIRKEEVVSEAILKLLFFDLEKRKSLRLDDELLKGIADKW